MLLLLNKKIWFAISVLLIVSCSIVFAEAPGTTKWTFKTGGAVLGTPSVDNDGTIYCGSQDAFFYALNPDGTLRWKFQASDSIVSKPLIGLYGAVYFTDASGTIYHLYSGHPHAPLVNKKSFGDIGGFTSSPVFGPGGDIYCGHSDGNLYAIDAGLIDFTLKWKYQTGGIVSSTPAFGKDDTIYFGSADSYIYALNPDKTFKWRYKTGGAVYSSPTLGPDGTIYCASADMYVYALNSDGKMKWRYKTGDAIYSSPARGSDGTIYCGSEDRYLYALYPDGTLKWRYLNGGEIASTPVVGGAEFICYGSNDGNLYCLNPDGSLRWTKKTGSYVIGSAFIGKDNTIYFGSYDTGIYAMKEGFAYYLSVFKPDWRGSKTSYWSGLGIMNRGTTASANVQINIYNQLGNLVETETKIIPSYGQDAFNIGFGVSEDGWIKVISDQPLVGLNFLGRYLDGTGKDYYLADVPFTHALSNSLKIPHVAQNTTWDTTIYIANPDASAATVIFTYINKAGIASKPYTTAIASMGSKEIPLTTIAGSSDIKGGHVDISSTAGVTAFALYNNLKTGNYSYAGINASDISKEQQGLPEYYLPVFKPHPGYWSGLGITNLSMADSASILVSVYSPDGVLLTTESKKLAASGQDAFQIGTTLTSAGWIKVSSDQPLAGLNFLGDYEFSGKEYYLADVPFTDNLSEVMIIPHVAQNDTWETTVFAVNPNDVPAQFVFYYFDKKAMSSQPYLAMVPARGSIEVPVSDIGKSNVIKGGFVLISCSSKATAFALYNNLKTGNFSYAGINAVDISE